MNFLENIKPDKVSRGIAVIRRINYFLEDKLSNKKNLSTVDMDHAEILKSYMGIEGDPWPVINSFTESNLVNGLVASSKPESAISYYQEVSKQHYCDVIFMVIGSMLNEVERINENITFCGFDYGLYCSEYNCYSAIFNEIIYGKYEELKIFSTKLNKSLLLPTADLIKNFHEARNSLVALGADLETAEVDEEFLPIAIYRMI